MPSILKSGKWMYGSTQRHIVTPKQNNNLPATSRTFGSYRFRMHSDLRTIVQLYGRFTYQEPKNSNVELGSVG